jgi:carbon-monoxide dehydrogenase large subunit
MSATGIGVSVKRVEDLRFLTGNGHYTDDINQPGQSHAWMLRSPHAHATLKSVDTAKAAAAPGVIAIFTGADMAADEVGGIPCGWQIHNKDGSPMAEPGHPPLAVGKVRHVGDQIAIVIAETRDQARDAAEMIVVDYGVLPAVINMDSALAGGALVHDDVPNNRCFDWEIGDKDGTEVAFANADHVVSINLTNNRLIPNAMEPRFPNSTAPRVATPCTPPPRTRM